MPTVRSRSVLGALLVSLTLGAAPAAAVTPGPVSVRVEGASATLVPPTLVATQSGSYTPVGKPSSCPGTSAAEAFDLATLLNHVSWDFEPAFGPYFINSIGGELHPTGPTDGGYWAFWYDHKPASAGICTQPLNPNDEILFFPDCFSFGKFTCPAGFVSPNVLGLTVTQTTVQRGAPLAVNVLSYANLDGTASAAGGATVSGGGASATTGPDGAATIALPSVGTVTLQATAPNSIRSETRTVCVHDGNDGNCGTTAPPGSPPPAPTPTPAPGLQPAPPMVCLPLHPDDGTCGTIDKRPPTGHLAVAEGARFRPGHGPRTLAGHVDADPSGLRDVLLRLTRLVTKHRCEAYSATRRRFATAPCGVEHAPSFSVGRGMTFSYLLPARLTRGRYTLDVEAIDAAGNHDRPAPARNRVVFRVE